jgi:hypothetical protein
MYFTVLHTFINIKNVDKIKACKYYKNCPDLKSTQNEEVQNVYKELVVP